MEKSRFLKSVTRRHCFGFLVTALLLTGIVPLTVTAQGIVNRIDTVLPVRGLAIHAPSVEGVDLLVKFIEEELAPSHFNLLILQVDWSYDYKSHPELRTPNPLKKEDIKKLVAICRKHGIKLVPQVECLGHQSDKNVTFSLLREYPHLDETPHVIVENYKGWPNPDGLYCKSYCPLHPEVHPIMFDLIDEITEVFESNWFHAGLDEVFYIGDSKCPRCGGKDPAELLAHEINTLQNHLAQTNKRLMIWGDRLIDGKETGIGEWQASMNNTYRAIDMIPKDVFICDWHYDRPDLSAVLFAMKGFDVATCPWRKPDVALIQVNDMIRFRTYNTPEMTPHFQGIIETVWTKPVDRFLNSYYDTQASSSNARGEVLTLKTLMEEFKKIK